MAPCRGPHQGGPTKSTPGGSRWRVKCRVEIGLGSGLYRLPFDNWGKSGTYFGPARGRPAQIGSLGAEPRCRNVAKPAWMACSIYRPGAILGCAKPQDRKRLCGDDVLGNGGRRGDCGSRRGVAAGCWAPKFRGRQLKIPLWVAGSRGNGNAHSPLSSSPVANTRYSSAALH